MDTDQRIISLPEVGPGKLALVKQTAQEFGIPLISCEYEIILLLYESGPQTAGHLMEQAPVGSTAFFKKLGDLLAAGLIEKTRDPEDRRRSLYRLAQHTISTLDEEILRLMARIGQMAQASSADGYYIQEHTQRIMSRLRIRLFSCEFHIILILYEKPKASAGDIFAHCHVSSTKFYTALEAISRKGLVLAANDTADGRRKLYSLSSEVRHKLDIVHAHLHTWMVFRT